MRRITLALVSTLSALILLFSYHTSTAGPARTVQAAGADPGTSDSSGSAGSAGATTYTGDAVNTRWGIVQVEITVADAKITRAEAIQYPQENPRDQEINSYAIPLLNEEAVQAQSAQLDSIGGATVTVQGYIASLQSAIDQAHL
ncbi:MAG TPA: FMN-binding protein [Candidatus Lustribacter sp.]|nr:FMN-binding protein [Candidatus Lustribacter sp.]